MHFLWDLVYTWWLLMNCWNVLSTFILSFWTCFTFSLTKLLWTLSTVTSRWSRNMIWKLNISRIIVHYSDLIYVIEFEFLIHRLYRRLFHTSRGISLKTNTGDCFLKFSRLFVKGLGGRIPRKWWLLSPCASPLLVTDVSSHQIITALWWSNTALVLAS